MTHQTPWLESTGVVGDWSLLLGLKGTCLVDNMSDRQRAGQHLMLSYARIDNMPDQELADTCCLCTYLYNCMMSTLCAAVSSSVLAPACVCVVCVFLFVCLPVCLFFTRLAYQSTQPAHEHCKHHQQSSNVVTRLHHTIARSQNICYIKRTICYIKKTFRGNAGHCEGGPDVLCQAASGRQCV